MKCFVRQFLLLMVAVLFAQCGRFSYHPKLVQLDSLADSNADSAVSLMHQIEPLMAEADERDRHYFELLSIKVADKADLLLPTDTAAWQLVDWYEQHGDRRLLPMAYYYAARVCRTRNDSPQALDYLLKAHDLLRDDDSQLHLKAVVNSQMGYIFSQQKLYHDAINSFKDALTSDKIANDSVGLIFDLMEIGFNFENVNSRDSSIVFLKEAADLAQSQRNEKMVNMLKVQIANMYYHLGKYYQARTMIKEAIDYNDSKNQSAIYSVAANIYKAANLKDSALFCYHILTNLTSVYAKRAGYRGLSEHYSAYGNLGKAHYFFSKYRELSDSIDKITASNAVAQMHSLYNYQLRERENQALRKANEIKSRMIYTIVIVITLLILLCIIAYSYIRHKDLELKVKLERRQRVKVAMELADIREKDKSQQEIILRDSSVVKSIMRVLNDPNDVNKVLSEEIWDELEKGVLDICPSFKTQITDICKLSDFKYHVCLLLKANLSIANIAQLTQHSTEAVTSTRRRMAKNAFGPESTPQDWDLFIAAI